MKDNRKILQIIFALFEERDMDEDTTTGNSTKAKTVTQAQGYCSIMVRLTQTEESVFELDVVRF